jgi:hypothetical protein
VEFSIIILIGKKISKIIKLVDVLLTNFKNLTIIDRPQTEYIDGDLRELANLCPKRFSGLIKVKFDIIQRFSADYKVLEVIFTRLFVAFIY